jgi:hypothetical protein
MVGLAYQAIREEIAVRAAATAARLVVEVEPPAAFGRVPMAELPFWSRLAAAVVAATMTTPTVLRLALPGMLAARGLVKIPLPPAQMEPPVQVITVAVAAVGVDIPMVEPAAG